VTSDQRCTHVRIVDRTQCMDPIRSSRSFDDGVELSRRISEKSRRSCVFEVELVDFIQKV